MWIAAIILLLIALFFLLYNPLEQASSGSGGRRKKGKLDFYSKGFDSGFSIAEIKLLWAAAKMADLDNPPAVFGSVSELDKTISQISKDIKISDMKSTDPEAVLLKKLFDYRKRLEMNKPRNKSGLKSTRDISIGQKLAIRVDGGGLYTSKVVENEPNYLTITIPAGEPLPPGFSWRLQKLNIYFWRKNDAGYFFQTKVIDAYHDPKSMHFRLYHSDNILRSQKRKSIRSPAKINARMYLLKSIDEANQWPEASPGLSCEIVDLSEDGAAVRIGGRGKKNSPLKFQFKIKDETVVVSGIVKRVDYNREKDESILHVEFMPPPELTRMILLSYVFNINNLKEESFNRTPDKFDIISGVSGTEHVSEGSDGSEENAGTSVISEDESGISKTDKNAADAENGQQSVSEDTGIDSSDEIPELESVPEDENNI